MLPDLGIPKVLTVICRSLNHGVARIFGEVDSVIAVGHVLVLPEVVLVIIVVVVVTRVNQIESVSFDNGRSGKAAAGVFRITGNQGDW